MIVTLSNTEAVMASEHPTEPTLQAHHEYKSWSSTWYDIAGKRHMKRFGREGDVSKKEALAKYTRWVGQWRTNENVRNPGGEVATYRVSKLCEDYGTLCEGRYLKEGAHTSYIYTVRVALRRFRESYGDRPCCELTGPMMAVLRDALIWSEPEEAEAPRPLKRGTVNGYLAILKRAITWACSEKGKVPEATAWAIAQVSPVEAHRTPAGEPETVLPIADAIVDETGRHCSSIIADMIRVNRLTGMRPGEVCLMRGADIEAGGDVWIYRPSRHKTQHHGKAREVCIGPMGQAIIQRRLKPDTSAYLFSPTEAVQEWSEKSGQRTGNHKAGARYNARSFRQAIHRACCRAFDADGKMRAEGDETFMWNPNQLRHRWATEIRKAFGIEEAAIGLGHSDLRTTEIYAERDRQKAMDVARKVG